MMYYFVVFKYLLSFSPVTFFFQDSLPRMVLVKQFLKSNPLRAPWGQLSLYILQLSPTTSLRHVKHCIASTEEIQYHLYVVIWAPEGSPLVCVKSRNTQAPVFVKLGSKHKGKKNYSCKIVKLVK